MGAVVLNKKNYFTLRNRAFERKLYCKNSFTVLSYSKRLL
jgi:hypothetical protein